MKPAQFASNRLRDLLLIGLFAVVLVLATLSIRVTPVGKIPAFDEGNWASLSLHSLTIARNWQERGLWNLRTEMMLEPLSIESTGDAARGLPISAYSSYSPLFLFPVHLYQLLVGRPVHFLELMELSFAVHMLTACLLGWLAYLISIPAGGPIALGFGLVGAAMAAWNFSALHFLGNCWWPDMAVIPVLAAFYLTLLAYVRHPERRLYSGLLTAIALIGCLTDWSFSFHLVFAGLLLAWREGQKRPLRLLAPPFLIAHILFLIRLWFFGNGEALLHRVLLRSGNSEKSATFLSNIETMFNTFEVSFTHAYAFLNLIAFLMGPLCLALDLRMRRKPSDRTLVFLPISLAILFHAIILQEHYAEHHYEWIKLVIPYSLAFSFFPTLFTQPKTQKAVLFFAILASLLLALESSQTYKVYVAPYRAAGPEVEEFAKFIDEQTVFEDVLFSTGTKFIPNAEVPGNVEAIAYGRAPAFSHKYAYQARTMDEMRQKLTEFFSYRPQTAAMARIKILVEPKDLPQWEPILAPYPYVPFRSFRLYSLHNFKFL